MVILGTPNVSFGLEPLEWLVIIGVVSLVYGIYLFNKFRRKKKELERENKELIEIISKGVEGLDTSNIRGFTAEFNHLELHFRTIFREEPSEDDQIRMKEVERLIMEAFPMG